MVLRSPRGLPFPDRPGQLLLSDTEAVTSDEIIDEDLPALVRDAASLLRDNADEFSSPITATEFGSDRDWEFDA